MVNSTKGEVIITRLPNVVLKTRLLSEAIEGNDTLKYPTEKPEEFDKLLQLCGSGSLYK